MNKVKVSDLRKVESSNLDLIAFDGDKTFIKFKNGKLYEYPNTTKEEFTALAKADSVGKHFFKSYKHKTEFTLLEDTVLEQKRLEQVEMSLSDSIEAQVNTYRKAGKGAEAGALLLLKAAIINNDKAKEKNKLKVEDVVSKYFNGLENQKAEYAKLGVNTELVEFEMSIVQPFVPVAPIKLSDEEVKKAVTTYIGSKGFTKKDMGAIMRVMKVSLGNQNGQAIAKYVKEALNETEEINKSK